MVCDPSPSDGLSECTTTGLSGFVVMSTVNLLAAIQCFRFVVTFACPPFLHTLSSRPHRYGVSLPYVLIINNIVVRHPLILTTT
jgi:hypothetical protein